MQLLHFHDHPPRFRIRRYLVHKVRHTFFHLAGIEPIGKVIKYRGRLYASLVFIFSQQQIQKSRLSLPVSADKSKFPVRIDAKRYLFKNIVKTAFIAEC